MIRPGSHIIFDTRFERRLEDQWNSNKVEPSLRFMIIVAGMLFHEQGSSRVRILKILGNTQDDYSDLNSPHHYGCAADISIKELVDPRVQDIDIVAKSRFPKATFITRRLNSLFPMAQGDLKSAVYNVGSNPHIHLQVPVGGFNKDTQALSTWNESGSIGHQQLYTREDARRKA